MTRSVEETVRRALADLLGVPLDQVGAEASTETLEPWDSLAHLNLLMSLEQTFDVHFAADEIPELTSVSAVSAAVRRLTGLEGGP